MLFAGLAAPLGSCAEPPAMRVGPVTYTESDLGVLGPAQRRELADLTAFGVTVAEDRTEELTAPFVAREARSLVLQRLALEVAVDEAGVDERQLREAYSRRPEPELVVRHLVILSERWRPEEHREAARERAAEALRRARAGEPFEALVAEYSEEPGAAERGGLLRPSRRGAWAPEFWEEAVSLREGELSQVVETEFGFHVLRLEERRTVPFEEVREDVLERFVDLPRALARAQEWAERQSQGMALDTSAILAWRSDRGTLAPDTLLVRWSAGSEGGFSAAELDRYVSTSPATLREPLADYDPAAFLEYVAGAARNVLLAERARVVRGLTPSASQLEALERRWRGRVERWAEALGFAAGQSPRRVKDLALQALGGGQQGAAIARSELEAVSGVLRDLYPTVPPPAREPVIP